MCEIGKSWGCIGQYDWSPVLRQPFSWSFEFKIWDTNPPVPVVGAEVQVCDATYAPIPGRAPLDCPESFQLGRGATDAQGAVVLPLAPKQLVSGYGYPRLFLFLGATEIKPGQPYRTFASRLQPGAPPQAFGETWEFPVLSDKLNAGRYLSGLLFDCRASRLLAGEGLRVSLDRGSPNFTVYFSDEPSCIEPPAADCATTLTGTFTMNIGDTSDVTAGFRGYYTLSVDNRTTGQRGNMPSALRIRRTVR